MITGTELGDLLGYQLQRAYLAAIEDVREALSPHGLTPAKLTALLLIRDNPGCDQTALGRALRVNRSSAMKIVNALAERGLIERRPGRDLRSNALHLTAHARSRIDAMLAAVRASDDRVTKLLSEGDRGTLLRLLTTIAPHEPKTGESDA